MKGMNIKVRESMKLPSGASIPRMTPEEADRRRYLSHALLNRMHLTPAGDPVAYSLDGEGRPQYYYDPNRVVEAAPELWYRPAMETRETRTLENGTVVEKMNTRQAAARGYYTRERLNQMRYDVTAEPVAYNVRGDGSTILFYDKRAALRRPLRLLRQGAGVQGEAVPGLL